MAQRIKLGQDFENNKEGDVILVANWKLKEMTKNKIKFNARLIAGTGSREYVFEEKEKPEEESKIINKHKNNK